jgi:hypothetical protein
MRAMRVYSLHEYSSRCIHTQGHAISPEFRAENKELLTNDRDASKDSSQKVEMIMYHVIVSLHHSFSYPILRPVTGPFMKVW